MYCDGYLRKPVGRSDLVAQLMRFLPYTPRVGAAVKDLTTEALMALPTEWLHTFSRAVNGADTDECLSLTHALPPEFASVTVALESMVRSYRFDRLIELVLASISDSHDGTKETI